MNRFFIDKKDISGNRALVSGDDAKHIASVLRLARGDGAALCDGEGSDYAAVIDRIEKDRVTFTLLSSESSVAEPEVRVTLFQGLPKAGKFESIIQKCVELGVHEVVPVAMRRSVVKLTKREFAAKLPRYQRVAYEAAKQAQRGIVPKTGQLAEFEEIDPSSFDAFIMPYEEERDATLKSALRALRKPGTVGVVIGPEGGFDPGEALTLREKGAVSVTLGRRILRTETAGPAVLAMLLYELEGHG